MTRCGTTGHYGWSMLDRHGQLRNYWPGYTERNASLKLTKQIGITEPRARRISSPVYLELLAIAFRLSDPINRINQARAPCEPARSAN